MTVFSGVWNCLPDLQRTRHKQRQFVNAATPIPSRPIIVQAREVLSAHWGFFETIYSRGCANPASPY